MLFHSDSIVLVLVAMLRFASPACYIAIASGLFVIVLATLLLHARPLFPTILTRNPYAPSTLTPTTFSGLATPVPAPDLHAPPLRILLVSAFFPLPKSKHSLYEYDLWMTRFLGGITTEIYMFCPPDIAPRLKRLRGDLPLTLNTTYASPFEVPPLRGLEEKYKEMHSRDLEAHRHSPELYAVWNAKPFFLAEGARARPGRYDFVFWCDAGSMRDDQIYTAWPDAVRVQSVFTQGAREAGMLLDELIFFPVKEALPMEFAVWTEEGGPADSRKDFTEGSLFGGAPAAVDALRHLFYAYHDAYLARGIFVGKDQALYNQLILQHSSHFLVVWMLDPHSPAAEGMPRGAPTPLGACPVWWYYQWWLAREDDRARMADAWLEKDGWNASVRCREVRVRPAGKLFADVFGRQWAPQPPKIATWGVY